MALEVSRPVPRPKHLLGALLQTAALGAALWFLVKTGRSHSVSLALSDLRPLWTPFIVASVITVATYLYVVGWWNVSLGWWGRRLRFLDALHIFFVTNLARFIPGVVWQFAGVVAMVQPHGVSPVAATGAIIVQQIILLATGLGLAVITTPALLGPWAASYPPAVPPLLALAGVAIVVILLPRVIPFVGRVAGWLTGREFDWPSPGSHTFGLYAAALAVVWVVYGIAFWLFGRSLYGPAAPPLMVAAPAYLAGYMAGMLAFLVPSGLLVREAALVAALSGSVGGGRALTLAVGARLWLLALEILTTLGVIAMHRVRGARRRDAETPGGSSR